ncbi:MAG: hypothetical protein AB8B91_11385 [Rubripirellula sp.]
MLHEILGPIQRRLWLASVMRSATIGLLCGTGVALLVAVVRLAMLPTLHWGWTLAALAAGLVAGVVVGFFQRHGEQAAASLVDDRYGLKDRSISSLQFAAESEPDEVRQLQIAETRQHLQQVDPVECVPLRASTSHLRWAGGLCAATLLVLVAGSWFAPEVEATSVLPLAQQQSSELRETMLPELEKLAEEQADPEVEELVKELMEKIEEMETEAMDEADLLATLSEMEQSLAEARESLQLEMTDTMMKSLAAAMKPSDMMRQAAAALESEKYDEASEQLESMDPSKMGDKQRRAVADNLKKMLAKLKPGQQGKLSESIGELAEGLESKNSSQCKECLSKLASACKKQGQCKKIGNCMACQLNRLSQCKSQCRGQCESNSVAKSDTPSTKAGKGASGKPLGDQATRIDSVRNEQQLTGVQGEGASETEILQAPEGEQRAARQFAAKYDKFKREAEAVLNSEPLPMGHRETVRTYFEAIRPNNDTEAEMGKE